MLFLYHQSFYFWVAGLYFAYRYSSCLFYVIFLAYAVYSISPDSNVIVFGAIQAHLRVEAQHHPLRKWRASYTQKITLHFFTHDPCEACDTAAPMQSKQPRRSLSGSLRFKTCRYFFEISENQNLVYYNKIINIFFS